MVTNTPAFPQGINNGIQTFVNADAQTQKTLFTPGSNGSIIDALLVSSSDTSNRDIVIGLTISATFYPLTIVSIPLTAGTVDTIPGVDILRSLQFPGLSYDAFGNRVLKLASGSVLTAYAPVTVTSGKSLTVFTQGRDL